MIIRTWLLLLAMTAAVEAEPYRRGIMVTDGIALALVVGGAFAQNGHVDDGTALPFITGGVALYALGGPVIHALHGRRKAAAKSLGLRLAPLAVTIVAGGVYGLFIPLLSGCQWEPEGGMGSVSAAPRRWLPVS